MRIGEGRCTHAGELVGRAEATTEPGTKCWLVIARVPSRSRRRRWAALRVVGERRRCAIFSSAVADVDPLPRAGAGGTVCRRRAREAEGAGPAEREIDVDVGAAAAQMAISSTFCPSMIWLARLRRCSSTRPVGERLTDLCGRMPGISSRPGVSLVTERRAPPSRPYRRSRIGIAATAPTTRSR